MKITGIEIDEYHQFKNIKFDFTYPEGHPKAGQPLEKVCFIGHDELIVDYPEGVYFIRALEEELNVKVNFDLLKHT